MSRAGTIQVVVKSRRVPVGMVLHTHPVYTSSGVLVGSRSNRLVLYAQTLAEEDRKTVKEAQKLACNLGLGLNVVYEKSGLLGGLLSRLAMR